MNNKLIHVFYIGILLIILHQDVSGQPLNSLCDMFCLVRKNEPMKIIECSNRTLPYFPIDCDSDVRMLDLSYTTLASKFPFQNSFHNYTKLVKLRMRSMNKRKLSGTDAPVPFTIPSNFFATFPALEEVDLSYTKLIMIASDFKWPPKLRILHVIGCRLREMPGLGAVQTLQELHAAGNILKALPKINKNSSIHFVDLRDNPLDTVDVSILAPLCELNYLGIKVSPLGTLNTPKRFCHCLRLRKWIEMARLIGEEKLICNGGILREDSCEDELVFASNILDAYNACLEQTPITSLWELLFFAIFFSILFPIMYFGYEAYNSFRAPAKKDRVGRKRKSESTESARGSDQYSSSYDDEEDWENDSENEEQDSHSSSRRGHV